MRSMLITQIRASRWVFFFLLLLAWGGYSIFITASTGRRVVGRFAQLLLQPKLVAATLIVDRDWSTLASLYADTYTTNSDDLTSPYTQRLGRRDKIRSLLIRQPDSRELNYQLLMIANQMQDKASIDSLTRKIKTLDPTFTP